jgi:hypothetical protein
MQVGQGVGMARFPLRPIIFTLGWAAVMVLPVEIIRLALA